MILPPSLPAPVYAPLPRSALVAFALCWAICVAAWVRALLDHRGLRRHDKRLVRRGLTVCAFSDPQFWQPDGSVRLTAFSTDDGHVLPLDAERVAFFPNIGGAFEFGTGLRGLLLYTGVISWRDGPAFVHVRVPLGMPIFIAAWVTGWLLFAFTLGPALECAGAAPGCSGVGIRTVLVQLLPALIVLGAGTAGVCGIRRRARSLYAQVREGLRAQVPPLPEGNLPSS